MLRTLFAFELAANIFGLGTGSNLLGRVRWSCRVRRRRRPALCVTKNWRDSLEFDLLPRRVREPGEQMTVNAPVRRSLANTELHPSCNVLLIAPRFNGQSFWNFSAACEVHGAKFPAPPLGLITVAALLPPSWECRLINRNTEELSEAEREWADLVMTGGMMPQRPDTLTVIALAQTRGKPVVVGGPDATSSPEAYVQADFRVLGEAEGIIAAFIAAWDAGER